eukprot:10048339-Prorocentrum_lima.AAC.1
MTSSLVGSEMCIRDSYSAMQCFPTETHAMFSCTEAVHLRWKEPGSFAVSYTHLTLPTICSV